MPFSPEQSKRVLDKVNERLALGGNRGCSVCGSHRWMIQDGIVALSIHNPGEPLNLFTSRIAPSIVAVCGTCSNTLLFNLLHLGLQDLGPPPAEES